MDDPGLEDAPAPRRPFGVTLVAVFYVVLGAHAIAIGLFLAVGSGVAVPATPFLAQYPSLVRDYGLAHLAFSVPFFANGVALLRQRWWARWLTVALVPLHIIGPPYLLGGMLFALAVNGYLFGSGNARTWLGKPSARSIPEP